ncbi:MAG: glycosyltransferase family 4 protein, partial [Anaerolineae bacterium]|nr:glycosyltransferase family 4 protein [Anaerolineae bacterium]
VAPRSRNQRLRRLLTDRRPDMAHRIYGLTFAAALTRLLRTQPFAVVQVEGIELAAAIPLIRKLQPDARIIFDDHNAEAALQERAFRTDVGEPRRWPAAAYSWLQTGRLQRFERWACRAADRVVAVSEADRDSLRALLGDGGKPIAVIPNAIDVAAYQEPLTGDLPRFDVIFSGKMDYRPNVDAMLWFGREIWPRILEARPATTWAIVGQQPHARLQPLRALPGVTITGRVDEVRPYLAGATVYVMPLRMGSGTRLKLIEALAVGVPLVSTRLGAEGFPVAGGRELLLAETPDTFARAVLRLLDNDELRTRLSAAGRHFAWQYDWHRVMPRFVELVRALEAEAAPR